MAEIEEKTESTPQPETNRTPPKPGSRTKGLVIFGIVTAIVLAGIWGYNVLFVEGFESTDDAQIQGHQAIVSSQILGQVRTLAADLGDAVSKGEIVATLDDSTQKTQRDQALIAIEAAKANLNQAKLNAESSAQAVHLQFVKLQQAKSDYGRGASLYQAAAISQEDFEHDKWTLSAAQASYEIAVGQQRLAQAQGKSAEEQLKSAQTQLETVEAAIARVVLPATIDGIVARKWVELGDIVQPAQPLYTLFDLKDLWVDAYFKETQVKNLKVGDPVTVAVDAFPGLRLTGKVDTLGVTTAAQFALIPQDNTSGNFTKLTQRIPVRIALDPRTPNPLKAQKQTLVPGMSVEVSVRTGGE